ARRAGRTWRPGRARRALRAGRTSRAGLALERPLGAPRQVGRLDGAVLDVGARDEARGGGAAGEADHEGQRHGDDGGASQLSSSGESWGVRSESFAAVAV